MGDNTKKVERGSQATPFAESYLAKLQKQLKSEAFGTGIGPLQRQAGDATGKLLSSLQGYSPDLDGNLDDFLSKVGQDGGGGFRDLLGALEGFDTSVNAKEDAAQTKGVAGFGELDEQLAALLASGGLDVNAEVQGQQTEGSGNINRLIDSLFGGAEGGPSRGNEQLINSLIKGSQAKTDRSAADLREQGGIFGNRFGSSLATGEALLRSEADTSLGQTIGALLEQGRQFDTGQLQEAINQQFGQGTTLRDQDFRNLQTSQENRFRGRDQRSDVLSKLFGAGTTLRDQDYRNQQSSVQNRLQKFGIQSDVTTNMSAAELSRLRLEGETLNAEFNQRLAKEKFNLDLNDQQIEVIKLLHGQGQANLAVFERMATLGILPEEVIQSKSFWGYMGDLGTAVVSV